MAVDHDTSHTKVISPSRLAHVVLRTNNFLAMVDFYKTFLGATATYENEFLALLTYDEEHHRVAILSIPAAKSKDRAMNGLDHFAFTFDTLEHLLVAYRQRKDKGILPHWPINHGPTTSIYYLDPDGNKVETQVDNFDTAEEMERFMTSPAFHENPIGTEFDPDDLLARLQQGVPEKVLKERIETGPRGVPEESWI